MQSRAGASEYHSARHHCSRHWINRALLADAKPVIIMRHAYKTEHAIYGTVLVSALIAVGWNFNTDLQVLLFTLGTVGVFWLSHIYSGAVASERSREPRVQAIVNAVLASARHSVGMVIAMLLPSFFLLLAVMGVLDEYVAYYIALWIGVAILALLGYGNSARRGSHWSLRLLSAALTAGLGLGIIWLSSLVH